ncbi:MAG: hypothetical protein U9R27_08380 [Campylobacterota bacterium]|nr:hypothetical protein [Campylobacterota bacterium]
MKQLLLFYMTLMTALFGQTLAPLHEMKASGIVYDIVADEQYLYAGTGHGELQIFDHHTQQLAKTIILPKIKDFMGDEIYPKVFSVDHLNGKYLLMSEGKSGYRNLYIHENGVTEKIISVQDRQALAKARFIDDQHVFLGTLGNEVILYNFIDKKEIYRFQISQSKFSDFALNTAKDTAVIGCESGEISVVDVQKGRVIQILKGENLDNTYRVDIKNSVVTGAGQDRRGSYYKLPSGRGAYFEGSFLIYATALSPSGKKAAYAINEANDIGIFDLQNRQQVALLKGQKSTLNTIIFLGEKILFSASSDPMIMMWKLP